MIAGSDADLRTYISELGPPGGINHTLKKTRFGEIVRGMSLGDPTPSTRSPTTSPCSGAGAAAQHAGIAPQERASLTLAARLFQERQFRRHEACRWPARRARPIGLTLAADRKAARGATGRRREL